MDNLNREVIASYQRDISGLREFHKKHWMENAIVDDLVTNEIKRLDKSMHEFAEATGYDELS